ncbi:uncharacterized protein LOC111263667 isoform X1 [Varroa jacobsoni]|uniref:uncharacterized protein LOC111263667 isoform X1 n=1 Tax=Varroa jacobsoni TaxID=62625 RepID=UPI000BF838B6|nr:uncharacterized protein LOC111263667 isoform X1 [Varroa jacobsoni]
MLSRDQKKGIYVSSNSDLYTTSFNESAREICIGNSVGTVKQLHDTDALTLLPPDDIQFGFEKKIGPIVLHGQAKLHDGTGAGLDMIHRVGDASVDIFNDSSVKVKCCLGMDVIERN